MARSLVSHFESILENRRLFMGIAIVMVVLYHSMGTYDNRVIRMMFYPGFLGVDIFLLLSGYGLCNSYNQNSLHTFYKHRITRLVPLFLFLALSVTFIRTHIECKDLTLWELCATYQLSPFGA